MVAFLIVAQWPGIRALGYRLQGKIDADSAVAWQGSLPVALEESRRTGKPVLVDFYADWCPLCVQMKHETWADPAVSKVVAERYIPVLADAESADFAIRMAAGKYEVEELPRVIVIDADGRMLKSGSFLDAGQMLEFLNR